MQKRTSCPLTVAAVLIAGTLLVPLNARAQAAQNDAPITANFSHAPIQTVLNTLFHSAGIRNFTLDAAVQGNVNVSLSDVPFALALRQTLAASNPPLAFSIVDGVYHVGFKPPTPMAEAIADPLPPALPALAADTDSQSLFYKIGVKHYDAGMMADLATRPGGIIVVPPNFVVPANANATAAPAGPAVTTVGAGPASAFGAPVPLGGPAALGPARAPAAANNVLPDGVKRIYARESDNSLVIETTPGGYAGLPL